MVKVKKEKSRTPKNDFVTVYDVIEEVEQARKRIKKFRKFSLPNNTQTYDKFSTLNY